MSLEKIRERIDGIDDRIMRLLNDRMKWVLMVRRHKTGIEDRNREKEIFDRIGRRSQGLISAPFIEKVFGRIIEESKVLQRADCRLMAFQGEAGAFGEAAARAWSGDLAPVPCDQFADVFEGVEAGLYDYGILPVENTSGGVVGEVNERLINTDLRVVGAVDFPVRLCLLAPREADHREIRHVYSHPQALAQCRQFLKRNRLDAVPYGDTAGAARMLSEKRPEGSAAVAGRLAGELYRLHIIKEDIEDLKENRTRFFVLARKEDQGPGDKCSIVFSTEHKAGTLFRVIEVFARKGINLTRIESIPHEAGRYAFFLDFQGSTDDENVLDALSRVEKITTRFRMMGCYRERRIA